ncbi:hypothetical protein FHW03_001661 [Ochrobactrum sp. RH2CCR150]|nr:hypothetical protein [Ochrobactrum sp. RH2CCR150]
MPFRSAEYQGTFNPTELEQLQLAYTRCCETLEICPATHEGKDRIARLVMRVFEESNHDPELTAMRAAELARLFD